MAWQVQEAKQRFSELLRRARRDGPQVVTLHGKDVAVLVSIEEFERLNKREPRKSLQEFLLATPDLGDLEIERDRSLTPVIDLSDDD